MLQEHTLPKPGGVGRGYCRCVCPELSAVVCRLVCILRKCVSRTGKRLHRQGSKQGGSLASQVASVASRIPLRKPGTSWGHGTLPLRGMALSHPSQPSWLLISPLHPTALPCLAHDPTRVESESVYTATSKVLSLFSPFLGSIPAKYSLQTPTMSASQAARLSPNYKPVPHW